VRNERVKGVNGVKATKGMKSRKMERCAANRKCRENREVIRWCAVGHRKRRDVKKKSQRK